ncbi:hypothetical protein [Frankia nepalensis]|uniref:hypothetical protein n=1 Tax=Frankia nepalensis TaxID=1836974 RepID=UPI0019335ABC|nr:hypothetical protein [Frankia nepalensis]MBL7512577.1 hypothetical protein [Frankia nepalensis]
MLSDDGAWVWDAVSQQWLPHARQPASPVVPGAPASASSSWQVRAASQDDFFAVERVGATEPTAHAAPAAASQWRAEQAVDPFAVSDPWGTATQRSPDSAGLSVTAFDPATPPVSQPASRQTTVFSDPAGTQGPAGLAGTRLAGDTAAAPAAAGPSPATPGASGYDAAGYGVSGYDVSAGQHPPRDPGAPPSSATPVWGAATPAAAPSAPSSWSARPLPDGGPVNSGPTHRSGPVTGSFLVSGPAGVPARPANPGWEVQDPAQARGSSPADGRVPGGAEPTWRVSDRGGPEPRPTGPGPVRISGGPGPGDPTAWGQRPASQGTATPPAGPSAPAPQQISRQASPLASRIGGASPAAAPGFGDRTSTPGSASPPRTPGFGDPGGATGTPLPASGAEPPPNIFFTPARGLRVDRPGTATMPPGAADGPNQRAGATGSAWAGGPPAAGAARPSASPWDTREPRAGQPAEAAGSGSSPWRAPTGGSTGGTSWAFTRPDSPDAAPLTGPRPGTTGRAPGAGPAGLAGPGALAPGAAAAGPPSTGWRAPAPAGQEATERPGPWPPAGGHRHGTGMPVIDPRDPLGTGDLPGLADQDRRNRSGGNPGAPDRPAIGPAMPADTPARPGGGAPLPADPAGGRPFPGGPADAVVPAAGDSPGRGAPRRGRHLDSTAAGSGPRPAQDAPGTQSPPRGGTPEGIAARALAAAEAAGHRRQTGSKMPPGQTGPKMPPTGERPAVGERPGPVEMTSVLSRTGASRPRRGTARDVPADRRRTPNPMTDSLMLQAVAPEKAPADPKGPSRAEPDQSGPRTGQRRRARSATGPRPATGSGQGGRRDWEAELDPLTGSGAVQDGRAAGTGRRFGAEDLEDALEPDAGESPRRDQARASAPAGGTRGAAADRLAWFHQGWLGPLTIAVFLALVGLGLYVLIAGRGGEGHSGSGDLLPTMSAAPVATNPDAKAGKALADGTYACRAGATPAAGASGAPAAAGSPGVLFVPPTTGKYVWNGEQGDYAIATPNFNNANVIASVAFTSGPLKDQVATSIATWPSAGGRVTATLNFTKGNSMYCDLQ